MAQTVAEGRGIPRQCQNGLPPQSRTEPGTGADALQPPLRCGFRARLTASVRQIPRKLVGGPLWKIVAVRNNKRALAKDRWSYSLLSGLVVLPYIGFSCPMKYGLAFSNGTSSGIPLPIIDPSCFWPWSGGTWGARHLCRAPVFDDRRASKTGRAATISAGSS